MQVCLSASRSILASDLPYLGHRREPSVMETRVTHRELQIPPGADPGVRRGGFVHSEGGGGVRTGISGADPNCCRVLGKSTSKKKLQTAVGGGGPITPQKNLYPRMTSNSIVNTYNSFSDISNSENCRYHSLNCRYH